MHAEFTKKLLRWNKKDNHRQMPWKGETDPYKIWLSEIMLQQTRVEQGWAYYEKFIKAFPTVHELAAAPDQQVFKMWEGLGYYSRCKNLLATARIISKELKGKFPGTYDEILKLKGIGPYTAAAIASFAFNENKAVVDGNVQRVISRYFGISTAVDSTEGKKLYASLAQTLIDEKSPGTYNQAIMDFGATICKPRNPLCEICVEKKECVAFNNGYVHMLPVKEKKLKTRTRWLYYFIIESAGSVYIRKREEKDIWQNLHEFVLMEKDEPQEEPEKDFLDILFKRGSYQIKHASDVFSQQLTHQRIYGRFFVVQLNTKHKLAGNYMLIRKKDIGGYAFPKFINSFLESSPFVR
jgi:A/G-specific adenine glycosylase